MADCKDIDKALAALSAKIDAQNKQIADLRRKQEQCCSNKNDNQNNNQKEKPVDLSEIYKRLDKAEKDILELGGIVKSVIDDIKDILDSIDEHNQNANQSQNVFSGILNFLIDE